MAGIYIHIPFCKQACHYCNFHFSTSLRYKERLVEAIVKEITISREYLDEQSLKSIYLGGGTPSLLNQHEMEMIIGALANCYYWNEKTEITLEANPDDINKENLKLWKDIGINRLSIGIQSFFDEDLKWMNRAHNSMEAEKSIRLAQENGFENLTIDLIYGCPTTSNSMWESNINRALSYEIDHISSYCLTVEKGTALSHFVKKGKVPEIDQRKATYQFDTLIDTLSANGFDHYEISNFARNGRYSVHNSSYWKGMSYLGLGPGAHSFNGNSRKWNISNNIKYIKAIEDDMLLYEEETLSKADKYNEYVITRIRTKWGLDLHEVPEKLKDHFLRKVNEVVNDEYLIKKGSSYVLTRKGKHFADLVSVELMHE